MVWNENYVLFFAILRLVLNLAAAQISKANITIMKTEIPAKKPDLY